MRCPPHRRRRRRPHQRRGQRSRRRRQRWQRRRWWQSRSLRRRRRRTCWSSRSSPRASHHSSWRFGGDEVSADGDTLTSRDADFGGPATPRASRATASRVHMCVRARRLGHCDAYTCTGSHGVYFAPMCMRDVWSLAYKLPCVCVCQRQSCRSLRCAHLRCSHFSLLFCVFAFPGGVFIK